MFYLIFAACVLSAPVFSESGKQDHSYSFTAHLKHVF